MSGEAGATPAPERAAASAPLLTLRPFALADAPEAARLCDDRDVARMTSRMPFPYALADAEAFIRMLAESKEEVALAIETTGVLAGAVGWRRRAGEEDAVEIGYWIGRPYWGRGYATAAARAALPLAFAATGCARAEAWVFQDNPASARVLEKLGFQRGRAGAGFSRARGGDAPTWEYALACSDWEARR